MAGSDQDYWSSTCHRGALVLVQYQTMNDSKEPIASLQSGKSNLIGTIWLGPTDEHLHLQPVVENIQYSKETERSVLVLVGD